MYDDSMRLARPDRPLAGRGADEPDEEALASAFGVTSDAVVDPARTDPARTDPAVARPSLGFRGPGTEHAPAGPLHVTSIDTHEAPSVTVYFRVDTEPGCAGDLDGADIRVVDDGESRDARVRFADELRTDVVLCFADAGSMLEAVVGARDGIAGFVDRIRAAGVDARFALVSARDGVRIGQNFTYERAAMVEAVHELSGSLTGEPGAVDPRALRVAAGLEPDEAGRSLAAFRDGAQRVLITITDATAFDHEFGGSASDDERAPLRETLQDTSYLEVSDLPDAVAASPGSGTHSADDSAGYSNAAGDGGVGHLVRAVGGTWVQQPGSTPDDYAALLTDRLAEHVSTTYAATYEVEAAETGARRSLRLEVDDPDAGELSTTVSYEVGR